MRKTIGLSGLLVAELGDVRGVVAADAEDRGRARDRLQQRDLGERVLGPGGGRRIAVASSSRTDAPVVKVTIRLVANLSGEQRWMRLEE